MRVDRNAQIRATAFAFLDELRAAHGEAISRESLSQGFQFEGRRVPLIGPQGIFKPAVLNDAPLSITTAPEKPGKPRPYEDEYKDDVLSYKYRDAGPEHHENVGLRRAMANRIPLVYFSGLVPGKYAAAYPVFIIRDDIQRQTFSVQVDDMNVIQPAIDALVEEGLSDARRQYITRIVQQRLHQQKFRERVLAAYGRCCSICRIKHNGLLDAAHIIPDKDPLGLPVISNGLALCKIHHAAFDQHILGIRPDLVVEIRADVLKEIDGPMLLHGIQELHRQPLLAIPSRKEEMPRKEFLEMRYDTFRKVFENARVLRSRMAKCDCRPQPESRVARRPSKTAFLAISSLRIGVVSSYVPCSPA